jgi:CheY-like chemotaxis protein
MQDGKHVILVVDDDHDILESLRLVLEANNYIVATALSAEEGLRVYKTANPDLLIVDLMMEEVDAGTSFPWFSPGQMRTGTGPRTRSEDSRSGIS